MPLPLRSNAPRRNELSTVGSEVSICSASACIPVTTTSVPITRTYRSSGCPALQLMLGVRALATQRHAIEAYGDARVRAVARQCNGVARGIPATFSTTNPASAAPACIVTAAIACGSSSWIAARAGAGEVRRDGHARRDVDGQRLAGRRAEHDRRLAWDPAHAVTVPPPASNATPMASVSVRKRHWGGSDAPVGVGPALEMDPGAATANAGRSGGGHSQLGGEPLCSTHTSPLSHCCGSARRRDPPATDRILVGATLLDCRAVAEIARRAERAARGRSALAAAMVEPAALTGGTMLGDLAGRASTST